LTPIATSVGSQTDLDGAILFIEELKTRGLGLFDRQLTQLIRAGAFQNVRGVAIGLLESYSDHTDRGWTLLDVLQDRLGGLGVPVLGGFFAGHGGIGADGRPDMDALALGARAELDVDAGTLTVGLPPHQSTDRHHEPSRTALSAGGA
jgi:muramoyltetrapeptide carboxypeptidase